MTLAQKQLKTGKMVTDIPVNEAKNNETGEFIFYIVKSGDTLWGIANKNPGNSDKEILKLNNLTSSSKIKPGQTLKIRKKI
jgi:membrane-bound lytic murein transglycosylase D